MSCQYEEILKRELNQLANEMREVSDAEFNIKIAVFTVVARILGEGTISNFKGETNGCCQSPN